MMCGGLIHNSKLVHWWEVLEGQERSGSFEERNGSIDDFL